MIIASEIRLRFFACSKVTGTICLFGIARCSDTPARYRKGKRGVVSPYEDVEELKMEQDETMMDTEDRNIPNPDTVKKAALERMEEWMMRMEGLGQVIGERRTGGTGKERRPSECRFDRKVASGRAGQRQATGRTDGAA